MHRFSFYINLLFIACTMYGQNNVNLVALDGTLFKVKSKGGYITKAPQSSVLIEHIVEDTLNIQLEVENGSTTEIPLYLLEKGKKCQGKEFNFRLLIAPASTKLVFSGIYDISPLRSPIVPVKPVIDTMPAYRNRFMGHLCELKNGEADYFNNIPKNGKCEINMPDQYLDFTKQLIQRAQTDEKKHEIVENVCRNNCLSVSQFSVLLNYIAYEVEKLALLKLAYFNFTDPQNSRTLNKSFRFDASVAELNDFLKNPGEYALQSGTHCKTATDSSEINKLCRALTVRSTDAERLVVFKKMYTSYCYSIDQVKKIMLLFIHDREKTDVAKALYFYCIEKENYGQLLDLFSYNESRNTLRNFVEKQSK